MKNVLKKPVVTEKMEMLSDKLNQYAFVVDDKANKIQIRNAVESMYSVKVTDVNTMVVPAKATSRMTKSGMIPGRKGGYKKAVVTLAEGDMIDFYSQI
jgi:large subunit ribosomal protein L23